MPRLIPRPADIDIDIMREMYHSRGVTVAGMDPRLNASRLGQRLGVGRAKVAARIKEWTTYGLIERFDVLPNPALFGLVGVTIDVRVVDRFQKEATIDRLGLVDGIVGGSDFVGEWITVQVMVPGLSEAPRRAALIRGIAGVAEVGPPIPWAALEPRRGLTPLDLRIVRVLRSYPRAPLSTIARHVGVSTRTITTRYGRLVEDLAVWFVPVLDFRALTQPVVSMNVKLRKPTDRESVARHLRKAYPQSLEFVRAPFGPVLPESVAVFFVLCPSSARMEELEGYVAGLDGVEGVEALTMIRVLSFPATCDRLLAEQSRLTRPPD